MKLSLLTFLIYIPKAILKCKKLLISPTSEIVFSNDSIKYFRESFKLKIKDKDDFYKSISNKDIIPGSEQFYPILYEKYDSIINYLDDFDFLERIQILILMKN